MRSPKPALVVLLIAASSGPRAVAQLVAATAEAIAPLQVSTTFATNSAPAGTNLTPGFIVATNTSLPGGRGAFARATYGVTITGNAISYRVDQDCSIAETSSIGVAMCGSTGSPHTTRLILISPGATTGTLTVVATGSRQGSSSGLVGALRSVAVDIGNDGTTEWSTTAIGGGSYRQQVTVAGRLEIRVSAHGSIGLFPVQTLDTVSLFTSLQVHFEPLTASCLVRNGNGINPVSCSCATLPVIGTTWAIAVATAPNTVQTMAFAGGTAAPVPLPTFGELLIAPPWIPIPGTSVHLVVVPNAPALIGAALSVQGARLNAVGPGFALELTNALDAIVGV